MGWICSKCGAENSFSKRTCDVCDMQRGNKELRAGIGELINSRLEKTVAVFMSFTKIYSMLIIITSIILAIVLGVLVLNNKITLSYEQDWKVICANFTSLAPGVIQIRENFVNSLQSAGQTFVMLADNIGIKCNQMFNNFLMIFQLLFN